jgi:hypothetical protein
MLTPEKQALFDAMHAEGQGLYEIKSNTGKTPGVAALFSCPGSGEPDSSYV